MTEPPVDPVALNTILQAEIAERQRAEEQMRQQNEYLAALHETTLDLISHLDLRELLEALVARAAALFDTSHGLIYIIAPGDTQITCRVAIGAFTKLIGLRLKPGEGLGGTIWQTGQPLVVENYDQWPERAKSIEYGFIRCTVGVPLISRSQVTGVLSVAYDYQASNTKTFTEREIELLERFAHLASVALDNARLYTSARESQAAAEAAYRARTDFLSSVSHELRTPLTSIIGFSTIVEKRLTERIFPLLPTEDTHAQRTANQIHENLHIIQTECNRLSRLINDLLDLEKIQAGKMPWKHTPLRVADVIRQAAAETAPAFNSKHLKCQLDLPPDLPETFGDHDRLVQVMMNLLLNAVKFTDAGSIICRAREVNGAIQVSVSDPGIGISPLDQASLFEKFVQSGDPVTRRSAGSGLGLPLCKAIIEYHGGRIWVESEPGKGSTFSFTIPVQARPGEPREYGL